MKTIIIAEAGVNHNGNFELAKQLVVAAALAGADYIKFQTFKADKIVSRKAKKAAYQETADCQPREAPLGPSTLRLRSGTTPLRDHSAQGPLRSGTGNISNSRRPNISNISNAQSALRQAQGPVTFQTFQTPAGQTFQTFQTRETPLGYARGPATRNFLNAERAQRNPLWP